MEKRDATMELLAAASNLTAALEEMSGAQLARSQVVLIAQLVEEVRRLAAVLEKRGAASGFTGAEVKRLLSDEFAVDDEATYDLIARLAKDEARLKRAMRRVLEAKDVKNRVGLLIRILQKWNA